MTENQNKVKKKNKILAYSISIILLIIAIMLLSNKDINSIETSSNTGLSNKTIGWGIKRNDNNEQPDLGSKNKALIDKYNGMAMGNKDKKYIYLTFDEGYEAGYTPKILETLKNNDVKATFFITAHFVNTQEDLVRQMIDEGHIVGNQLPPSQMYQILKNDES